jgi:hypothetical protein
MLEVRVRNVSKPVLPPQKVAIRAAGDDRTIEATAEPTDDSSG